MNLSDSAGWMIQALKSVLQDDIGPKANHESLDGIKDRLDDVRTLLEDVGPNKIEQMDENIFAA